MTLSQLVFRSMLKNMRHYYLYFFALIFSVTLYFSFVTLQYNQSVAKAVNASGTAAAGFEAATYMLYFIVLFFVLYANHLFMKRRSKEIGMFQLIGMTKGLVFRLIALENIVLFVGAVVVGMMLGFLSSRIFAMILLKVLEHDVVVGMSFSIEAVQQTCMVFAVLLAIILVQMGFIIRRVTLLSLFSAAKQADERVKRFSPLQMVLGAVGLCLIIYGYYSSTKLFAPGDLLLRMTMILATTIGGTFLIFRFSVAFIMNLWRMRKNGHLSTMDVVAVTPLMHRMKGNAKSLTLITVMTAVSLAITTLSYIAYYSIDKMTEQEIPADYVTLENKAQPFLAMLDEAGIKYESKLFHIKPLTLPREQLLENPSDADSPLYGGAMLRELEVISESAYRQLHPEVDLANNEAILTAYSGYLAELFPLVSNRTVQATDQQGVVYDLHVIDIQDTLVFSMNISRGYTSVLVVSDEQYDALPLNTLSEKFTEQLSINLKDDKDLEQAEALYLKSGAAILEERVEEGYRNIQLSKNTIRMNNLQSAGIVIFTTAFLGLAFLMATGSILYFKQMAEADEEQPSYAIMRKIGFSEQELMRGIYMKQLFNFGVPLVIGLCHSYFAVKSGWWLFGSELTTPLLLTMSLYIGLYVMFALLSIQYYRKVVRQAL